MNPNTHRSCPSRKGAAMIEGALVTLSLISMVIFIIDMGRFLLIQQYLTERTRATARAAVVHAWDQASVQKYLAYNSTTAPAGGTSTPGFLGILPSQVTYNTLGVSGTPSYRVQVKVSGVKASLFIPYIKHNYTLPTVKAEFPAQSMGATN